MTTAPRRFAESYIEITNRAAYDELAGLFAEDAVFLAPGGQVFRGRDEIGAFYVRFLSEITPTIRISSYVEEGDDCVYELEAITQGTTEYALGAIDHATFDANGLVTRFAVFTK